MGYQDRHYYRDSGSGAFNPLMWILNGSVPLFTFSGIRVRAHASLILFIVLVLLFGLGDDNFTRQDRVESMSMLFLIVLLHEFGHCFAARRVGGDAHEILMSPLGGLAFAQPPRRWLPTFITVAAGPAVNVVICIICGAIVWQISGQLPWNPLHFHPIDTQSTSWLNVLRWSSWIYQISYFLLIFNLLPIFPLDGGQMVQSLLWPWVGYYKSMNWACITGMVGAVIIGAVSIADGFNLLLLCIAVFGFLQCLNMRRALIAMGPEESADTTDYSAAYETFTPKPKRRNRRAARRAVKLAREERAERERIDSILAKVSAHGMHSLTWLERRALKKATEHQRQRDLELSRSRRG